jgi:hypothetical protein
MKDPQVTELVSTLGHKVAELNTLLTMLHEKRVHVILSQDPSSTNPPKFLISKVTQYIDYMEKQ